MGLLAQGKKKLEVNTFDLVTEQGNVIKILSNTLFTDIKSDLLEEN